MKKLTYDSVITYLFLILLAITTVWDVIYREGEKLPRIVLILVTVGLLKLFCRYTFFGKSKMTYVAILIFIFFSMYLANVLNFYAIEGYDKMLHLASGLLIGVIGFAIYTYLFNPKKNKGIKPFAMVLFTIMFAVACAGVWEIWEFTTDSLFGLTAQNGLEDTMYDIICGTIGGIMVTIPIYLYSKGGKNKLLDKMIKEITD
ncbi:hypothetical protein [Clostridium sardiniense]|uniref:hypothetical protein n=1 Tax=Clostridium sardiniense TaxID=29369 RepID=UPI00195D27E3|nr:hypothetical protein [Clostridium sardiniense]MBM7833604.1 phosphoglycerol transferase MdoB-like AlkP superfamily enzyme [Clostridium sardiniense]